MKQPTVTVTGDGTQQDLQNLINQGIDRYGQDFVVQISENFRFENQNQEVKKFVILLKEAGVHRHLISIKELNKLLNESFRDNINFQKLQKI